MDATSLALYGLLALFMTDGLIEMSFIASMVSWLHISNHDIPYHISSSLTGDAFNLFPKPKGMEVNQGHTSNGAAGTAVVLIGFGGIIVFWLLHKDHKIAKPLYKTWFAFLVLETLLCLTALIYTFVLTYTTDASHQRINPAVAAAQNGKPYPADKWTPETWYKQVLALPFADATQRGPIESHLRIMEAWRWNLIPLLVIALALTAVASMRLVELRRSEHRHEKVASRDLGDRFEA